MSDKLSEVRRVAEAELADMPNREFVPTKTGDYVDAGRWSVARQILAIIDRPDERGEGDALRWLRENVASAFNAAYNEGLLDAPRGGYHDGTGVTKREYRSVWQEYEAKLRSALQPPAPTTGDEGKDTLGCGHGCRGECIVSPPPPHQAQTHAFVREDWDGRGDECAKIIGASADRFNILCRQPESAPCHGRKGK